MLNLPFTRGKPRDPYSDLSLAPALALKTLGGLLNQGCVLFSSKTVTLFTLVEGPYNK